MLGPVFWWEFIRSARRRWQWWARVLYVGLLLLFLFASYVSVAERYQAYEGRALSPIRFPAQVASDFYDAFTRCQLLAVVLLAPLYAGGSISEEKSRRTLPFLLASELSGAEIVFGKLALAVLRIWQLLLAGLPLCGICLLLGGVDPNVVFADFVVAITAAFLAAALAMYLALWTRRHAEGILLVFLIEIGWYCLPMVRLVARQAGSNVPIPDAVIDTNAFLAISRGSELGFEDAFGTYFGAISVALAVGLLAALLTWWHLRLAWRHYEAGATRRDPRPRTGRWRVPSLRRPRPPVWEHRPALWRELHARTMGPVDRVGWLLYWAGGLAMLLGVVYTWPGVFGNPPLTNLNVPQSSVIFIIYGLLLGMTFLAVPFLGLTAATAFSEERDGGMFDYLRTSLLSQADVVRAKALRLLRVALLLGAIPVILVACSGAIGITTLVGVSIAMLAGVSSLAFFSQFGLLVSLWARSTKQSIPLVLGVLVGLMVVVPTLGSMLFDPSGMDAYPLMLANPGFHMATAIMYDSTLDSLATPGNYPLWLIRTVGFAAGLLWTALALLFHLLAVHVPAGPWRESRISSDAWLRTQTLAYGRGNSDSGAMPHERASG